MSIAPDTARSAHHAAATAGDGRHPVQVTRAVGGEDLVALDSLVATGRDGGPTETDVVAAVHARVLAALTGEDTVEVVLEGAGGQRHRRRVDTRVADGHELLRRVTSEESAGVAAGTADRFPQDAMGIVLDDQRDTGAVAAPRGDVPVRVGWCRDGGRGWWWVRTDGGVDAPAATRIAGYHARALAQLVAAPDARTDRSTLLDPRELRHQLDGMAGVPRSRPELPVTDLIARHATARPGAVAVVDGDARVSYRELADGAENVARALRDLGVGPEDVVAVVTGRSRHWAVTVLGVLLAGAAYLPIDPTVPRVRLQRLLARAGARAVIAETATADVLAHATVAGRPIPGLLADTPPAPRTPPATPPPAPVTGAALAYVYFTSGSTGEPKGVMCEHAGMVNHLFAKIEDLGLGPDAVVAQTAPASFDISLWQLLAPLVVGGRCVLVDQATVLDVGACVRRLAEQRVTVAQFVPSYLEVVLTHLAHVPRALPDLRAVSVTGEALKPDLARRFFAAFPELPLVNAYGLTETSDDTNHAVLRAAPTDDRVPVGTPLPNVRVLVVDDALRPVPLGAPGEIVFSGVCVGRGYVNDPERTAAAFVPDPYRPGGRLYRSGDRGRWLPDGSLEFLGRRDAQVKVRGFRVELGEVDTAIAAVPGVRDAATVLDGPARAGSDRAARLVGFYTAAADTDPATVRSALARTLPAHLVPSVLHRRTELPLTGNGKVDRAELARLAADLDGRAATDAPAAAAEEADGGGPRSAEERRVAAAFAAALALPVAAIARDDHFFDRGGTSLAAVRLALALDRAVALAEIRAHPVVRDLAALLGALGDAAAAPGRPHPTP